MYAFESNARQNNFDIAYKGLASQGFQQSVNTIGCSCKYRGSKNRKCAIGHLILDSEYKRSIEGDTTFNILSDHHDFDTFEFYRDLQRCHDFNDTPEEMQASLRHFAGVHGLKIPLLEK